jgi:UDP-N-acetylglucosamine 2-epimerase (non-hydrolysing)
MQISLVAGTRPNFVKIAPIWRALTRSRFGSETRFGVRIIHTGQHFDHAMSQSFFDDLRLPEPHARLECKSGSHAEMTASIMVEFEKELQRNPADLVIVVGDVNSTLACSIVTKKLNTPLAHVEAGIRSRDMTMPEEINRLVTDSIADIFYTPSESATENLRREGVTDESIVFVGNVMIDSLLENLERLREPAIWAAAGLQQDQYVTLTMHRPATVDDRHSLLELLKRICGQSEVPIVFPVHPRTRKVLEQAAADFPNLILTEPMSYLEFIYLVKHARGVISDSGGVSEETTVLGVPCITLRANTERPETVTQGTNRLVGQDPELLREAIADMLAGRWPKPTIPERWDGKAAERIAKHLGNDFGV